MHAECIYRHEYYYIVCEREKERKRERGGKRGGKMHMFDMQSLVTCDPNIDFWVG